MSKKNYLITGGAGFIGSHLCEELLRLGHTVAAIDDLSTGSVRNLAACLEYDKFHFARTSVMDSTVLDRLSSSSDVVIHLAAAVGVQLIVDRPVHTIETNIRGTEVVLQSALRYNPRVLIASTSEVYGKGIRVPFSEGDDVVLGTTDKCRWAYAASKMVDEFLGHAYYREFDLPVVLFRLFNTVGPKQSGQYGMVVPRFVRQALRNQPISVFGDGQQQRCFSHVDDVVQALIMLSQHDQAPGELFNIGCQEEASILQLAERVIALTGSHSEIVYIPYSEAYGAGFEDMARRIPDTTKLTTMTGWKPTHTLDTILQTVIAHERKELAREGIAIAVSQTASASLPFNVAAAPAEL